MKYIFFLILTFTSLISFSQKSFYGEVGNRYDKFNDIFKYWNISSYKVGYMDSNIHIITGINQQKRKYNNNLIKKSTQLDLDIYPNYNKGYMWLNLSYSPDSLFPTYRSVFEIYRNLPNNFEASIGYRNNYTIDKKFIQNLTASVAIYHGNMWTNIRILTTHIPNKNILYNYSLTSRYYFKGKYDYLGVKLLKGVDNNPRIYTFNTNDVYMVRLEGKKSLNDNFKLGFGTDYIKQNIANKYTSSIGFDLRIIIII